MHRCFVAALALTVTLSPAHAKLLKIAPPAPVSVRAATAPVVLVGTVSAVEKDEVELPSYPGSAEKVGYKVAVVKVADALAGLKNETHVKVAFQPVDPASRRGGLFQFDFKEGAEGLYFLTKADGTDVYTFDYNTLPVEAKGDGFKKNLELVKKVLAVFADPAKALKAKENADRYFAAAVLTAKYRTAPPGGGKAEAVPAEESKLIFQAILESDWTAADATVPSPYQTFTKLGMTEADGWKPAPFNGGGDFNAHMKAEFQKWAESDAGKKFQVQKFVAK